MIELLVHLPQHTFNRFEIIAKRGIIARLSNNTSFRKYEKVDFLTFWPLHKKSHAIVSCTY